MDYSINSTETKTINLNNAELNLLDFLVSKRFNHIIADAKIRETFNIASFVCNPIADAMISIIGCDKVYYNWINGSNHNVDELINNYDDIVKQD